MLSKQTVAFEHDLLGNLSSAYYRDRSWDFKLPDAVGNLYTRPNLSDREYGPAGQLLRDEHYQYHYDEQGNLSQKSGKGESWQYYWYPNGMMRSVTRPDGKEVSFTYCLG